MRDSLGMIIIFAVAIGALVAIITTVIVQEGRTARTMAEHGYVQIKDGFGPLLWVKPGEPATKQ